MIWILNGHLSLPNFFAILGGVGMLLSLQAVKSLNNIERLQLWMMWGSFNGNSCTTIPTNASEEADIVTFYALSSLVWHIPKHNVLIISANMNVQIGKDENNKFCLHNSSEICSFSLFSSPVFFLSSAACGFSLLSHPATFLLWMTSGCLLSPPI